MCVIAVASGKGGVGKSFIASNLAYLISRENKKTLIVDFDLGGANLHHFYGISPLKKNLYHFLREGCTLDEIIFEVDEQLFLLPGSNGILGMPHLKNYEKHRIVKNIFNSKYDYVFADLGAGTNYNLLDFFNISRYKIIVMTSEQTSLENAYSFLKVAFLRGILDILKGEKNIDMIKKQVSFRSGKIRYVDDLKELLNKHNPESLNKIDEYVKNFKVGIILNMVKNGNELDFLLLFDYIAKKYLGFSVDKLGFIPYDKKVSDSIKKGLFYFKNADKEYKDCFNDLKTNMISLISKN
ncbi:MAG: AAA family ATPase [Deferribacterota bacterium]|nr:AAA family ATPase [Deferribacterota bacterium]